MKRFLLVFALYIFTSAEAVAGVVFGVVSERSAAEMAAGAHQFLAAWPEHQVVLRTPEQLAMINDAELVSLLAEADAVLLAAVFGDQVERLVDLLARVPSLPVLAVNGDQRLTRLSVLQGVTVLANLDDQALADLTAAPPEGVDPRAHLDAQQQRFPDQQLWLQGRAYFQGRSPAHMDSLLRWMLVRAGFQLSVPEPEPRAAIRYYQPGISSGRAEADSAMLNLAAGPVVAILDLDTGDRPGDKAVLDKTCTSLGARGIQCFAVLANWGGASLDAIRRLPEITGHAQLIAVVSLQEFTLGGGEGRREVTALLTELDVPVFKGIRLADRDLNQWRLSADGMTPGSVHYQLAMPELQGISQPMVLAVARPASIDAVTGVSIMLVEPVDDRLDALADRIVRWQRLQQLDNADKRIALIYYNHPPGRQNVGADNLDVPASLFEMLTWLKSAGYNTGDLPASAEELLDLILEKGVNLPEDRQALAEMRGKVPSLSTQDYRKYFQGLSPAIQAEMTNGPIGYLHARLEESRQLRELTSAGELLKRGIADLRHLLENHQHRAQARALDLLAQYQAGWQQRLSADGALEPLNALRDALIATGISGLTGWGPPPGRSMVVDDEMLFPALLFGNILLATQPPRGWELDEALLHSNTTFPPTHQYMGFYHWLREHFSADALVYVGRHSTQEFLPRRKAGMSGDDYPELVGGNVPLIYPYIVDGVGEGIQAKRRALGVMISHLTPPMAATELYDELLEMRQLVETYEAALEPESPARPRALAILREKIESLQLREDFEREIARDGGLPVESVSLDEVSDEQLVHEAGHYLTSMQERFMPLGLHVFGRDWNDEALDTMITSMAGQEQPEAHWREQLIASTAAERNNLLAALEGRFVPPGEGNDPIRTPEVLPTGRNFHALSSDLIPTRVAWSLGSELALAARNQASAGASGGEVEGSEALVLWASDTVRDEGVMIAFGMHMLGVRPRWNSRGIVNGVERLPLQAEDGPDGVSQRRDVLFTTSGLFRDLYEDQLQWLDLSVRLALQGASITIRAQHPQLGAALDAALAPISEGLGEPGAESLDDNLLAARWVADSRVLLASGMAPEQVGGQAALRVFGTAPGSYGAGINRLASRSGAWLGRQELAQTYRRRMGHAYGLRHAGEPAHEAFQKRLSQVGRTYLGRASHLYGLLDNDDGFDFQGGLSTAVEQTRGQAPDNQVLQYADANRPLVETLERALLTELRARNLNPQWLKPLMDHGYAGARTMGSDFLDNLWGWQVTNPDVVKSWVWDEVNAVYFQDRHGLGLDEFLSDPGRVHVKTHMQAVVLLAAQRGYWEADSQTLDTLAEQFAQAVVAHGLPGSGHTRPDHPLLDWVALRLRPTLLQPFQAQRELAQVPPVEMPPLSSSIREIQAKVLPIEANISGEGAASLLPLLTAIIAMLLLLGGAVRGRRIR